MKISEFLRLFDTLLEQPEGTAKVTDLVSDLKVWDSLTIISFIAMVDSELGVVVSPQDLVKSQTVNDLIKLVGDKVQG